MLGCFGHCPTFVRKLLLPEEGSICLGHEMLSWWSLQAIIICVNGVAGAELSCHKKNNTEDPSHIKGVISWLPEHRDSDKNDWGERSMGTVYPDMGQVSEHLIKHLQGQLLTVTLQSHSKPALFFYL